jgi:hypothetical protein
MTTAEFAKANLAALEEPVKIRRYTKAVGTYYPEGYIAALPGETVPRLDFEFTAAAVDVAAAKNRELEEEVKHLKKQLAAKIEAFAAIEGRTVTSTIIGSELLSQERRTVPQHPMKDAFSNLAKQDREFFERKLGKPGKTK